MAAQADREAAVGRTWRILVPAKTITSLANPVVKEIRGLALAQEPQGEPACSSPRG